MSAFNPESFKRETNDSGSTTVSPSTNCSSIILAFFSRCPVTITVLPLTQADGTIVGFPFTLISIFFISISVPDCFDRRGIINACLGTCWQLHCFSILTKKSICSIDRTPKYLYFECSGNRLPFRGVENVSLIYSVCVEGSNVTLV